MRSFTVYRRGDLSETHDANQVNHKDQPQFEGVVFTDGTVAIRWMTACKSTAIFADFDTLMKIHGHTDQNSKHGTEVRWHTAYEVVASALSVREREQAQYAFLLDYR